MIEAPRRLHDVISLFVLVLRLRPGATGQFLTGRGRRADELVIGVKRRPVKSGAHLDCYKSQKPVGPFTEERPKDS